MLGIQKLTVPASWSLHSGRKDINKLKQQNTTGYNGAAQHAIAAHGRESSGLIRDIKLAEKGDQVLAR